MWFRRDLRLIDNPALLAAIEAGDEIVPVFILDPQLIKITGEKGLAYLAASLKSLDESLENKLLVCEGDPVDVLTELKKNTKQHQFILLPNTMLTQLLAMLELKLQVSN